MPALQWVQTRNMLQIKILFIMIVEMLSQLFHSQFRIIRPFIKKNV